MTYELILSEALRLKKETEVLFKKLERIAFSRKNYGNKKLHGIEIKVVNLGCILVEDDEDVEQLFGTLREIYHRKLIRLKKLQEKIDAINTLASDA